MKKIKIQIYYKGIRKIKNEFKTEIEKLNNEKQKILDEYTKMQRELEVLKNLFQQKNDNNLNNPNE